MQSKDYILKWIFLAHKHSKKLKTYNKVSELILKGKMRLPQLVGMDPAEVVLPFTNSEMPHYGPKMNIGKEHEVISWERLTADTLKASDFSS